MEIILVVNNSLFNSEEIKKLLLTSYQIGSKTKYLRIRSAYEKGKSENRLRFVDTALTYPYIQPNSNFNLKWLVFDVDRDFNVAEIFENNLPTPNLIVFDSYNGHAHIWYGLRDAVWQQENFKKSKAYKFTKAIYKAICKKLDADTHFNTVLCKNPLHKMWTTIQLNKNLFELSDLASHLDLNYNDDTSNDLKKSKSKIIVEDIEEYEGFDMGARNQETFDFCRKQAYKYRSKTTCSETDFVNWCISLVKSVNVYNRPELDDKECTTIGESIGYWTYANIDPLKKNSSKYTDADREKSIFKRQKKAQQKIRIVKKFLKHHKNCSNRTISKMLGKGFSTDTVNRAIKQINAEKQKKAIKREESLKFVKLSTNNNATERFVTQVVNENHFIEWDREECLLV